MRPSGLGSPIDENLVRAESAMSCAWSPLVLRALDLSAMCSAHLCVHVLLVKDVSKPILWLKRPAWAIMIPLSMQNLRGR